MTGPNGGVNTGRARFISCSRIETCAIGTTVRVTIVGHDSFRARGLKLLEVQTFNLSGDTVGHDSFRARGLKR